MLCRICFLTGGSALIRRIRIWLLFGLDDKGCGLIGYRFAQSPIKPERLTDGHSIDIADQGDEKGENQDDQFYSHEEGSSNFRLSWGGGRRRKGACLAAEDSVKIGGHGLLQDCVAMTADSSYTYLNLTHLSGPIDKSYDLLLGAYLSDGDDDDPPVYSTLIRLTPPAASYASKPRFSSKRQFAVGGVTPLGTPVWRAKRLSSLSDNARVQKRS